MMNVLTNSVNSEAKEVKAIFAVKTAKIAEVVTLPMTATGLGLVAADVVIRDDGHAMPVSMALEAAIGGLKKAKAAALKAAYGQKVAARAEFISVKKEAAKKVASARRRARIFENEVKVLGEKELAALRKEARVVNLAQAEKARALIDKIQAAMVAAEAKTAKAAAEVAESIRLGNLRIQAAFVAIVNATVDVRAARAMSTQISLGAEA